MNAMTSSIFRVSSFSFLCILLASCASNPFGSYKATSDQQLGKIYQGQAASAMDAKETPDMLYNMEYGLLLRMQMQYENSNTYFGRTQQALAVWANSWASTTSGQISSEAVSMLANDNANIYMPRGYEKSLLATYYALNQIGLNDFDDARVEIKQMYQIEQATQNYNDALYHQQEMDAQKDQNKKATNALYQKILKQYDFSDINSPKVLALKNSYQSAFSHYLAGFVFEALNEPSLSRPGYVKAGQLNPTNRLIQKSIDNLDNGVHPKAGTTDLLVIEEVGHAPQIQSIQASIAFNTSLLGSPNGCPTTINIFYPKLVLDTANQTLYPYQIDQTSLTPMLMTDLNLMAARSLSDEMPHIIYRNIAAALRNIAISQAACSVKDDTTASILLLTGMVGGILLDKADERIVTLLPSKIAINRISLPYGQHTVSLMINGASYQKTINLNQPYQILAFRVIGTQVFFETQQSMVKK